MLALGQSLGLAFAKVVLALVGTFPLTFRLKDTDSTDWYDVTAKRNTGATGYRFDWDSASPVGAGDTAEWILEAAENTTRYRWGFKVVDSVLTLEALGTTTDPVTAVQIQADDGTDLNVVCRFLDGVPILDFEVA